MGFISRLQNVGYLLARTIQIYKDKSRGVALGGARPGLTGWCRALCGSIKTLSSKQPHLRGIIIFTGKREHVPKEILLKSQHLGLEETLTFCHANLIL